MLVHLPHLAGSFAGNSLAGIFSILERMSIFSVILMNNSYRRLQRGLVYAVCYHLFLLRI